MHYFVSDIHLGGGTPQQAKAAEERFCRWLDLVSPQAESIFICGDLFDFWFEYKRVAPKGFVRTLGRLATLADRGVRVVLMVGNHDLWVRDYFEQECGMELYTTPQTFDIGGRKVYIAHGDNLNIKRALLLKFMNSLFRWQWLRMLFSSLLHPDLALKFGQWWSRSSRASHEKNNHVGKSNFIESLVEYASEIDDKSSADYYIFGHLHALHTQQIESGAEVIFINDWSDNPHCAVMDASGKIKTEKV